MKSYYYTNTHKITISNSNLDFSHIMEEDLYTEFDILSREGLLKWYVTHIAENTKFESFMEMFIQPTQNNFSLSQYDTDIDTDEKSIYYTISIDHKTLGNNKLRKTPMHWKFSITVMNLDTKDVNSYDYSIPKESDEQMVMSGFIKAMKRYKAIWM